MRRRQIWLATVGVIVAVTTVIAVVATLNRRAAEEREQRAALVRAADLLHGIVDESLEELRAREDARPFDQYNEVYRPEGVVAASDAVAPSPLSRAPDDKRILGWFQVNPDGSVTLPHQRSRPLAAHQVRDVVGSEAFALIRALARPAGNALPPTTPALASLGNQQTVQELNSASTRVYQQLQDAEPEPQKRAAIAENKKLPTIARNDVDWSDTELDKLSSRAQQSSKRSKSLDGPSQKKAKEEPPPPPIVIRTTQTPSGDIVAVDYTPLVFDRVGGARVMHRIVSSGGGSTVQGVVFDEGALQGSWLPGLLLRRVGATVTPLILGASTPTTSCALQTPLSDVLDDLQLCFPAVDPTPLPLVDIFLLSGLLLAVLAALAVLEQAARKADNLALQKSAFISAISHELRTPLTTLRMHAELLRDGLVTDVGKQHRFHDDMVKESVRLGHLVENVLEAQRLEEGRRPLRLARLDLGEVVADVAASQRALCESHQFVIACDLPDDDVDLRGSFDRQAVEQILVNLIENAVKYARDADYRTITVQVSRQDRAAKAVVVVVVADHGPGIPGAERERVFQRFHRVQRAGEDHIAGTGLGLALVRELARAHGGDAGVVHRSGFGCAVEVRFPLHS